jgi:hypothetical protein
MAWIFDVVILAGHSDVVVFTIQNRRIKQLLFKQLVTLASRPTGFLS